MIDNGALIEYARYVNNYYGTPKAYVEQMLSQGRDVILEIEIQGALKVKEQLPDTLLLFITPPTAQELKERLVGRGTEDIAAIESRISRAAEESQGIEAYDYFVINDDLDACVSQIHGIIEGEHFRVNRNHHRIYAMRQELNSFVK